MKVTEATARSLKVGDEVCFKCDVEQYSEILAIRTVRGVTEFQVNVTAGDYGRGPMWIEATRCFTDP